jgi:XTP/dITP diphosphohydrolase
LIGRNHIRFGKVQEELEELQVEVEADQDKIEAEFGVLFSMINYARFNVNPEDALERTNKKFIKRFQYLESKAEI